MGKIVLVSAFFGALLGGAGMAGFMILLGALRIITP
jgi:hypothetical protein